MRNLYYGIIDSTRTTAVNKKTMTNVETGEKLDERYYILKQTDEGIFGDLDIAWFKGDVDIYEDYNLNNEAESGYELICHLNNRNVFRRKDFKTFYEEIKNDTK